MRKLLAAAAAAVVLLGAASPALAATAPHKTVRQHMTRLTTQDGLAGAVVSVREPDGRVTTWTSGTAERGTGRPMVGADAHFRIASVTKPVIAATVIRLVEQGRIDLDAPVERYAPGLLDGRPITVRQLLNQTSGLPEYLPLIDFAHPGGDADFLRLALDAEPVGKPGEKWFYSNTNYLAAGMLIEKVTGKDFRTVTRRGVLRPLTHTYWPRENETGIRGAHAHTYGVNPFDPEAQGKTVDTTRLPGYLFGASGGLISTPDDLNRFWQALPTSTIDTMLKGAVAAYDPPRSRYGLGVYSYPLTCRPAWMHDGGLPGTRVLSGRNRAGRAVTLYVTGTPKNDRHVFETFDAAMCS
ncbi:serine hydrolase domain-containing protein [Microtetraspora niveoalba]|uniref:serine hydrolase domain-containing protein n=1 Tax=Microtetraspora niveoalba TaxID=46175 RepID=UPI00082A750C|nr:serine hydrolase domain-containing protein [Microtetraspora niveoalba]